MKKDIDVLVIGSLNFDIIAKQERLPKIGETYVARQMIQSAGGKGANQAVQCSKLGLNTVMLGAIGEDSFGAYLRESLKRHNVNIERIIVSSNVSGLGLVTALENGEVFATISRGANYDVTEDTIRENLDLIKRSKVVCLQLEIPIPSVEMAIKYAKQNDCIVVLNGAPATKINVEVLPFVDYFILNEEEAAFYSDELEVTELNVKEVSQKVLKFGVGNLIITLGSKGSYLVNSQNFQFVNSEKVKAVDTTGAGDSYIGALIYGIVNEMPFAEMGIFATKVSAVTVQGIGAQSSMPFLNEIQ